MVPKVVQALAPFQRLEAIMTATIPVVPSHTELQVLAPFFNASI
jgi:hypothetical protein